MKDKRQVLKEICYLFKEIDKDKTIDIYEKIEKKKRALNIYYNKNREDIDKNELIKIHKTFDEDDIVTSPMVIGIMSGVIASLLFQGIGIISDKKMIDTLFKDTNILINIIGGILLCVSILIIVLLFTIMTSVVIIRFNKMFANYEKLYVEPYHKKLIERLLKDKNIGMLKKAATDNNSKKINGKPIKINYLFNNWYNLFFRVDYYIISLLHYVKLSKTLVRLRKLKLLNQRERIIKEAEREYAENFGYNSGYEFILEKIKRKKEYVIHRKEKLKQKSTKN